MEESSLLLHDHRQDDGRSAAAQRRLPNQPRLPTTLGFALLLLLLLLLLLPFAWDSKSYFHLELTTAHVTSSPIVVRLPPAKSIREKIASVDAQSSLIPAIQQRCDWVVSLVKEQVLQESSQDQLEVTLKKQTTDANVFYRATARIFWDDFALQNWNQPLTNVLDMGREGNTDDGYSRHDPLLVQGKATWTWVTGDQHLSNFGAWRNRHRQIVYGVNDFDESAIYDFQVDVLRIAVSIVNHGASNGIRAKSTRQVIRKFANQYVETVLDYAKNERAQTFEMTLESAHGQLRSFLKSVATEDSAIRQMEKFTYRDATTHELRFIKGEVGMPHEDTRLATVLPDVEDEIRRAFTSDRYGATMMKMGWAVKPWDDAFYKVLDIAARVGSRIGSFGVDRYYVLLQGTDGLLVEDEGDGSAVILDVKYQPAGAVLHVLNADDAAWYDVMFSNPAARVVAAQRRLTSYTDPYTGWIMLADGNGGDTRPFSVRQRSPWKETFDLSLLTTLDDFDNFAKQIAIVTATSHVRGSTAPPPGDFKHVIRALLKDKHRRKQWGKTLAELAHAYSEQVQLDFECVEQYIKATFPP